MVSGVGVGASKMVTKGSKWSGPGKSTKRSKIAFTITPLCAQGNWQDCWDLPL